MTLLKDVLKMIAGGILIGASGNVFRETDYSATLADLFGWLSLFVLLASAGMYSLYSGLRSYREKNRDV